MNMYNENDILTELFDILGVTKDDLKKIKNECCVKDSCKKAEEQKKPEPQKTEVKKDPDPTPECNFDQVEPMKQSECKETVTADNKEPQALQIAVDVVSVGNTYFELNKHAENAILGEDTIKIEFENRFEDFTFPGITDKQLLWVLYVRYMKDSKKLSLVKQLLATEL